MKCPTETEEIALKALRRLWIGYHYRYALRKSIGSTWYERKMQEVKSMSDFWKTYDLSCNLPLFGKVIHAIVSTDLPFECLEKEFLGEDI